MRTEFHSDLTADDAHSLLVAWVICFVNFRRAHLCVHAYRKHRFPHLQFRMFRQRFEAFPAKIHFLLDAVEYLAVFFFA